MSPLADIRLPVARNRRERERVSELACKYKYKLEWDDASFKTAARPDCFTLVFRANTLVFEARSVCIYMGISDAVSLAVGCVYVYTYTHQGLVGKSARKCSAIQMEPREVYRISFYCLLIQLFQRERERERFIARQISSLSLASNLSVGCSGSTVHHSRPERESIMLYTLIFLYIPIIYIHKIILELKFQLIVRE